MNGFYFNWMRRKFPDEMQYEEEYAPALSLIAAVNQLPVRMLDKTLGMKGIKFRKFMRRLKTFLEREKNVFGEECIYFFHRSFAEWLCSENADAYELSVEDGIQMLAETMADSYVNKVRQEIRKTISEINTLNRSEEHGLIERKLVKRIKREVFENECEC